MQSSKVAENTLWICFLLCIFGYVGKLLKEINIVQSLLHSLTAETLTKLFTESRNRKECEEA
jgi:hypothetical protein